MASLFFTSVKTASLFFTKMLSNNQLPDLADHIQGASRTDQSLGPGPFLRLIQTVTNRIGCFNSFHIFAYFPGNLFYRCSPGGIGTHHYRPVNGPK